MGSMLNLQTIGGAEATMSSREIADICEARHNDVVASIERLINEGVLRLGRNTARPHAPDGGGRPTMVYDLTKRDCLIVVSGYNAALRARIIDRWIELEAAAPAPVELSRMQILEIAMASERERIALAEQVEAAKPAVEFVQRYADSTGTKGFRQVAKLLGANENLFREFLIEQKILYRLNGELTPHAQHIDAGRFCVKAGTAQNSGHAFNSARFTPKGVTWVAGEWAKWQLKQREEGGRV
jgi:phage antirepressor YoqD-like protein